MKKKQILVCGTGFGKIYLKAIAESKEYELMGILGKGSDRSRLLSKNLNVPMYTDIKEINQNVDAACVVVPNAAGGGNGANIAKSILAKGIPTLLEHPAHEVEIVNCIRESGSAAFMLNPFYRYIKPIRDFLEAAQIISKHAHLINASLECAIHVLYDGIDILGCALGGLSTWKLGNVAESYTTSMAGGGNRVISGIIGMVPVTFIVNTNVDRNDIDHPLHLYHRIELTFSTGRLCLVNTHGPVIWLPFLHMPRDEYGTLSINVEEEVNIPSGVTIGNVMLPSVKETFEQIWPDAVKKALEILFKQNRTEKMSMAQYQIYVSKLWSEICQKVGYMNIVDYDNFGDIKSIFYDLSALSQIGNKKIVLNKFADMVKDLDGIILDIGAGTGKTTIEMANMICDKEIIALEPSAYMRTAFMARLMEHNEVKERISLLPIDVGKYSFRDKISGVMCMGVLGHLKRDEQEKLLYKLDKNLNINVPILIELLEPKFLVAPVGSRISVATQGRLRYETYITDIKQVGMDQWTWRLTYKVFCGKKIVSTVDSLMSWNYQSVEKILNQLTKMHFRTAKLSETLLLAIKAR